MPSEVIINSSSKEFLQHVIFFKQCFDNDLAFSFEKEKPKQIQGRKRMDSLAQLFRYVGGKRSSSSRTWLNYKIALKSPEYCLAVDF